MDIKELISREIDIPIEMIDSALSLSRSEFKKCYINKRNGGKRLIIQPSKKLKTIQYWIILNILKKLNVHNVATAYRDKKSILDNANEHKKNKYFLKVDLQDFFPSIKYIDLLTKIEKWHEEAKPEWPLDKDAKELIRLSCFFLNDSLAVGYPSSPIISNIVMYEFDVALSKLISDKKKFGSVTYTRYADDLTLSTNKKDVSNELLKGVSELIINTTSPNIVINNSKTKIGSCTGGTASVTGLKICQDERITIHRNQKDHIRLLLSLYKKNMLKADDYNHLLGHLSYVHFVDSAFYTKLQNKYFKEISKLRTENSFKII